MVGAGIGVLSWIAFAVVNNPIGVTTALSQISGGVASLAVGPDVVAANKYWAKNAFRLDYGTLFLVGTLLGGLGSALAAGTWRIESGSPGLVRPFRGHRPQSATHLLSSVALSPCTARV